MPYTALLSRETREAMGVSLEGAVVVVDEAHNIVEAINAVHSKRVVLSEVGACLRTFFFHCLWVSTGMFFGRVRVTTRFWRLSSNSVSKKYTGRLVGGTYC